MAAPKTVPPSRTGQTTEEQRPPQYASEGVGHLFQRDYVVVIEGSDYSPEELVAVVRTEFSGLSPAPFADFSRPGREHEPMERGDTAHVFLPLGGHMGVVLTDDSDTHFTLRTQEGHFEAGTITFGAARDELGRLVFRIRSRARINQPLRYLMYVTGGMRMQKQVWLEFLKGVVRLSSGRMVGEPVVSTDIVKERPLDRGETEAPTFRRAKES
jgi:hypothetical protein